MLKVTIQFWYDYMNPKKVKGYLLSYCKQQKPMKFTRSEFLEITVPV